MSKIEKARYWTGVLYPENMIENWQEVIDDLLQLPYAYCVHSSDKDSKSEHRKDHVHIIIAFPNTTTYKHSLSVFDTLSAPSKKAINTCEAVIDIRHMYDYLIHDTESCKKQGKELYSTEDRVIGNNFDIGSYEQISIADKNNIFIELSQAIIENDIKNYADFYEYVILNFVDMNYLEIMRTYSGHFERLTKGRYQKYILKNGVSPCDNDDYVVHETHEEHHEVHEKHHEEHEKHHEICCPKCGSVDIKKDGQTVANTQRFKCKDCGKRFC